MLSSGAGHTGAGALSHLFEHFDPNTMKSSIKTLIVALATVGMASYAFGDAAATWTSKCRMCHGADGNGTTTAVGKKPGSGIKDYTSAEAQASFTDEEAFKAIKEGVKGDDGKQKMPGYAAKGLTDEEITALVAHVRSFKK